MDLVIARPPGLRVSPRAESSCVRVYHGFHLLTLLVRSDSSMLGARAHHHRRKAPGTRGSEAAAPGRSVASDECLTFRADFVGPSDHTLGRRCCPASMRCWVTWVGGASRPPWAVGSPGSAVPPGLSSLLGHLGRRCLRPPCAVGSPGSALRALLEGREEELGHAEPRPPSMVLVCGLRYSEWVSRFQNQMLSTEPVLSGSQSWAPSLGSWTSLSSVEYVSGLGCNS